MPIRKLGRLTPMSERREQHVRQRSCCVAARCRRPCGMPTAMRQQRRGGRELERRGQPLLDQRRDLARLAQRQAELALHRVAEELHELHVERPVEAELGAQPRALLQRRVLPDHELHRVAGEIEQAERDERDHRHHQRGLQDAAEDEGEHVRKAPRALVRTRGAFVCGEPSTP